MEDRADHIGKFSGQKQNYYEGEFDSEKLDFHADYDTNKVADIDATLSDKSKIGIEDSRELSRINRQYDMLYTDKHSIFNLEEEMGEHDQQHFAKQSTMFGLEEDAQLNETEKVKIVNTIVKNQGGGKHTDYKIVGNWMNEQFIIMRRFKEFHILHQRLEERWPGFYIPPIPK